jgi:hypothetical protein
LTHVRNTKRWLNPERSGANDTIGHLQHDKRRASIWLALTGW